MSDFGDIDTADAWDADATIAPEQVTYRLHGLRVEVDELAGRAAERWEQLTGPERDLALAIGEVVVSWIAQRGRAVNNPAVLAESLHNTRVWMARGLIAEWDDLPPDHRQIGIDLMTLVVEWLEREGPR